MADGQPIHKEPLPGFDGVYGLELLHWDAGEVRGRVAVTPERLQPGGVLHGGIYAALAESLASLGTYVANQDKFVAGMSNHTTFLRPIREGTVHAVARPLSSGRTTWVWDVECSDDDGRLAATSRVTIAVRERRG